MYWQMRFAGQHVCAFHRDSPHEVWAAHILNIGGRVARIVEKRGNRHAFAAAFIAVAVVALVAAGFTVITLEPAVASHPTMKHSPLPKAIPTRRSALAIQIRLRKPRRAPSR